MDDLKELLDLSNVCSETDINKRFLDIAKTLMCSYVINKGDKEYTLVEIEFYLYSNNHQDYITYPRKLEAGRWFFHQSGVDISFKSVDIERNEDSNQKVSYKLNDRPCFGGILIRGIYDIKSKKYIFGPQKCVDVLWNDFDAFEINTKDYPVLKKNKEERPNNLLQCKRHIHILGDKQMPSIENWIKRLGLTKSDKETYKEALFDNPEKFRYRFFNMQDETSPCNCTKILPTAARPKENEIIRVS